MNITKTRLPRLYEVLCELQLDQGVGTRAAYKVPEQYEQLCLKAEAELQAAFPGTGGTPLRHSDGEWLAFTYHDQDWAESEYNLTKETYEQLIARKNLQTAEQFAELAFGETDAGDVFNLWNME